MATLRLRKSHSFNSIEREARVGIEPTHTAFAEPRLTTWLPRLFDRERLTYAIARRDAKQKFPREARPPPDQLGFDRSAPNGNFKAMIPELPNFTGTLGAGLLLALKTIAAAGFMTMANFVILYAS